MPTKINCIHNDKGAWCKNKKVPRSLLGLGARCCSEFNNTKCSLLEPYKRPAPPPNPPLIPDGQAGWIVGQGMPRVPNPNQLKLLQEGYEPEQQDTLEWLKDAYAECMDRQPDPPDPKVIAIYDKLVQLVEDYYFT